MVVQHNLVAMNSNRNLGITTKAQAKSTEKLSSGYKINRAADDAAGLSISEKMRRQIRGLTQASANAQDGISAVQTAEGALTEVHDMLQRMGELAVKGENGTLGSVDREYIRSEMSQLMSEIDRVQSTTTFNEKSLLDGTFTNVGVQVGAEATQKISITINNMNMSGLIAISTKNKYTNTADAVTVGGMNATGLTDLLNKFHGYQGGGAYLAGNKFQTADAAEIKDTDFAKMNKFVKSAIKEVSQQRSDLGAVQNRLDHTINNLDNIAENTTSAEAAIRDTNMATEMVKFSNNNILSQAGQSMLAQANQSNQGVLSLLG